MEYTQHWRKKYLELMTTNTADVDRIDTEIKNKHVSKDF